MSDQHPHTDPVQPGSPENISSHPSSDGQAPSVSAPYDQGSESASAAPYRAAEAADPAFRTAPTPVAPSAPWATGQPGTSPGGTDAQQLGYGYPRAEQASQGQGQQNPPHDAQWWSRPSGALSRPSWQQSDSTRSQYAGAGTQQYPAGFGQGPLAPGQSYPAAGGGTALATKPRTGRKATAIGAAVVLGLGAAFGAGYWGSQLDQPVAAADNSLSQLTTSPTVSVEAAADGSVQKVAADVLPSVVSVVAVGQSESGEGSGVVLTADGLILTNYHVINGATELTVRFNNGSTAKATVVGGDATDDLAVIKATGVSGLTPATLGSSSSLAVGQPVVAIGSPLGLSATVTSGIVSALNRPVRTASSEEQQQQPQQQDPSNPQGETGQSTSTAQDTVLNAVQTDAAINPGNSGGPLVDMSGRVVGINSAIASLSSTESSQGGSIGVGFSIPIDQAKRIADEIIKNGFATHAVLGASVRDAKADNELISSGATVAAITEGGAAGAAGLKEGDTITALGDQQVDSSDALIAAVRSQTPGAAVKVTFLRDGKSQTVDATLGSARAN